ncbi:MAG: alpha/beta fold hydrolase [Actinomycetota bacterium]
MIPPETKYTMVGDAAVGYQVVGEGPIDLVYVTGMGSNIETMWEWPAYADMLERIASFSRLILFDARGSGISDPLSFEPQPTWEHWTEDLRAVLEAAGSERTAILAQWDGCPRALLFAATYPERTTAIILWNAYAQPFESVQLADVPLSLEEWFTALQDLWGTEAIIQMLEPELSKNPEFLRWGAKYLRTTMSPARAVATFRYVAQLDVRDVLRSVRAPTLVLHRRDYPFTSSEQAHFLAEQTPGSRLVEFNGSDANIFSSEMDEILDEMEEFLTGTKRAVETDRVLATVLFTDIVGSTETASSLGDRKWKAMLGEHDRIATTQIERHHGRVVNRMGDGLLATFDGPGRAIRCAHALGRALEPSGIKIRAGLHTGEIELREGDDIGGIAVHIASRVMHEAGSGEVVCSRTVKDLVAGSEFTFDDRGLCTLKGVPDEWQLYAVKQT